MDTDVAEREAMGAEKPLSGWCEWITRDSDDEPLPFDYRVKVEFRDGSTAVTRVGDISWGELAETSVARYQLLREDEDEPGWRPWDAYARLPGPGVLGEVEIRMRDGDTVGPRPARDYRWGPLSEDGPTDSDIVAYRRVGRALRFTAPHNGEEVKWHPTPTARCPLPEGTKVSFVTGVMVNLAEERETDLSWSDPYEASSLRWGQMTDDHEMDIVRYKIHGDIPGDWHPHVPRYHPKRPCGPMDKVEIRTRSGDQGRMYARSVNWGIVRKHRDREVVAWRYVK